MPIVSIQDRYNITDRDSEDALTYCQKEKMGFIPLAAAILLILSIKTSSRLNSAWFLNFF